MSIRQFRPMTAGTRFRSVSGFDEITRDHAGEVAAGAAEEVRRPQQPGPPHHAAPGRRSQAAVPEDRLQAQQVRDPGRVAEIEYDPNRSARIALLVYADGEKRYILHPKGLAQGDTVVSGPGSDARTGNALPLGEIPLGTTVHNIELKIGKGGQMARTAGSSAQVVAREGEYVTLRLRSTEMRLVHGRCLATIGEVGNAEHELLSVGKAGKTRWLGKRPKVRGVAMNPVDHPLGGGEGKSSGGRPPVSPWGKPEGMKTRKRKKASTKLIVRGRKRGKATQ